MCSINALRAGAAAAACVAATFGFETTLQGDQILQSNSSSLTTYKYASASPVQGVRPRADQRGVGIDGTSRLGSSLPLPIDGNPFESPRAGEEFGGVRLANGCYSPTEVDLAFPAQARWVIGRSFNARQDNAGTRTDSDGYQGKNWFQSSQPAIEMYDDDGNPSTKQTADLIYLVYGADRYVEFQRTAANADTFRGVNGAAGIFQYISGSPDTYIYYGRDGSRTYFLGGNTGTSANGQIWKYVDAAGNTAYVGDPSSASTAVSSGYNSDGTISKAYDSAGRRYCYSYSTINSATRLTRVMVETDAGGGWGSCGTETLVGQVDYAYYQTGDTDYGDKGNLKLVTITMPLSDPALTLTMRKYYRYYTGTYDASTNPGYANTIKMVVGYEGVRAYDWSDNDLTNASFNDGPSSAHPATDALLKPYADAYFTYDTNYRLASVFFDGECGCSGGVNGQYAFRYEDNPGFTNTSGYDTAWHHRVVISPPSGGAWRTQYFDEVGQSLSQVFTDIDPATASPAPKKWVTQVVRNSDGQVSEVHTPANVTGYAHNTSGVPDGSITTSGSVGLVYYHERVSSGDTTGFEQGLRQQAGSTTLSSTSTYLSWTQYTTRDLQIATGVNVTKPLIDKSRSFHNATTNSASSSDYDETAHSYAWWDNATNTNVLYVTPKQVTDTAPAVTSGNNGSGSSTSTSVYFRKDGTTAFRQSARGIVAYSGYANGQLTKAIADAKTDTGTSYPSGEHPNTDFGIASSTAGLHHTTTYTYDAQGRSATTIFHDSTSQARTTMRWYAKLGDERQVTFGIPRVASYHGPATYTVTNQAGSIEDCMVVSIAEPGTSTAPSGWIIVVSLSISSDPLVAFDSSIGTISRLTGSVYGNTGRKLQERRVYFNIPGSLPGTEGTDYDAWRTGYDDMGRKVRTKDPTGTISRSVYDIFGRVVERQVGTNDPDEPGTDDMVANEEIVFDAGSDGGNGHVTQRTFDTDGNWGTTTDQRVTSYAYDYRGRLIVSTNAQPPHAVYKYDNLDRRTASALYSSSSGLDATTDPTSTTSNRVALSQTFYDEKGQAWKSQRHKIDQGTGADLDNLQTLRWFDPDGRTIKADGGQLAKTRFDRLGRITQTFTLASDDDASYGDVYDSTNKYASVSGDKVLEESQIGYDPDTDQVLVEAGISRKHDDTTTTGPLDTTYDGGDGLPLKFTDTDVKGRIQIAAMWYDSLERPVTAAFYGTNSTTGNVATFDRSGLTEPTASDSSKIVTKTTYGPDGSVLERTDPNGRMTHFLYDPAGRTVGVINNYTGATPPLTTETRDTDVYTRFAYQAGLQRYLWTDMRGDDSDGLAPVGANRQSPADDNDQVTEYVYGTPKGTPGSGSPVQSSIGTGHLLREVIYPEQHSGQSQADRTVSYAYNALSEPVWTQDQEGNVLQIDYDTAGRRTQTRVTTLSGSFDGAVRRIATSYLSRGRVNKVTQYDNATVGSGSVVDDVKYTYDEWGNLYEFKQDVDSDLDGSASGQAAFQVDYAYAKATTGRNTLRRTGMNLPGSVAVTYEYLSTSGKLDDAVSRVTDLTVKVGANPSVKVAKYEYLGVARLVGTDLPEPSARWNLFESASPSNPYPDLDRFNRATSSRWTGYKGTGTRNFYNVSIGYDATSNITGTIDNVHKTSGGNRNFDVQYTLDSLNRVTRAEEGTLSSLSGGSISNRSRDERWLDSSGNLGLTQAGDWLRRRLDLNGNGSFTDSGDLDETDASTLANEVSTRDTDSNGSVNYTLTHDKDGEETDDGKDYKYVYDAFGRLRQVKNRSTSALVAEYRYNGLGFRIGWHYDTTRSGGGSPDGTVDSNDPWFYFTYDPSWRVAATFRASDSTPKEVFVHHCAGLSGSGGSSKVDDVVLRDRDINNTGSWPGATDGTREERRYYCQNWRGDVSAILTSGGNMVEWIKYSSYGVPIALPAGDTDSDGDWDATDSGRISTAFSYDVRMDTNLDGAINASDITYANSIAGGYQTLGWGILSSPANGNRRGYAGYEYDPAFQGAGRHLFHVRRRVYDADAGRWTRRDPIGYHNCVNLYEYCFDGPQRWIDPSGLQNAPVVVPEAPAVEPWERPFDPNEWNDHGIGPVKWLRPRNPDSFDPFNWPDMNPHGYLPYKPDEYWEIPTLNPDDGFFHPLKLVPRKQPPACPPPYVPEPPGLPDYINPVLTIPEPEPIIIPVEPTPPPNPDFEPPSKEYQRCKSDCYIKWLERTLDLLTQYDRDIENCRDKPTRFERGQCYGRAYRSYNERSVKNNCDYNDCLQDCFLSSPIFDQGGAGSSRGNDAGTRASSVVSGCLSCFR